MHGLARLGPGALTESDRTRTIRVAQGQQLLAIAAVRDRFPITNIRITAATDGLELAAMPVGLLRFPEQERLIPDPILEKACCNMAPNSTATFLIKGDVPPGTQPGLREVNLLIETDSHGKMETRFPLDIVARTSTYVPDDRKINFWPNWTILSRHYGLELWSEPFWDMAAKFLAELASGGMNVVTAAITEDPFRYPLPEAYYHMHHIPGMIRWIRGSDGAYRFDYSVYDRYVELNLKLGIDREIECHSMLPCKAQKPWLTYYDEGAGKTVSFETNYEHPEYIHAWESFLTDFASHNRRHGWLDKITLCPYDEPEHTASFQAAAAIVRRVAPGIRISAAVAMSTAAQLADVLDIATCNPAHYDRDTHTRLHAKGVDVRWYNCCAPDWGNTLLCCPLADAYRLPWITLAGGFGGYLRWSAFNWTDEPWTDPAFNWPTGDLYLLYPGQKGPAAGLRWEAYRMGLSDLNLWRTAMDTVSGQLRAKLTEHLMEVGHFAALEGPNDLQDWRDRLYELLA